MSSLHPQKRAEIVKKRAYEAGFQFCGIAKADFLKDEAPRLEQWLSQSMHGQMHYMANHFDKRLDPRLLVDGAKSVVTLMYNYYPTQDLSRSDGYRVAKYAYGQDYHFVIKRKLKALVESLRAEIGDIQGRVFVDSAPVMERTWAEKSGLGWIGKNSLLLNKQAGSFFFLAEIITDLELVADGPVKDYCGTCTRCIDACPTDAIVEPYVVDGSKCISYYTIELKGELPDNAGDFKDWVFGCDICQDVCPWNRHARPHHEEAFAPHPGLGDMDKNDWEEMTEEVFKKLFKKSAVKRTKYQGLKRNIRYARLNKKAAG